MRLYARVATLVGISAFSLVVAGNAAAAPIEASADVVLDEGNTEGAREQGVSAARRAALEQALEGIEAELQVDSHAVTQVLAHAKAWTAAYRVLSVEDSGAQLTVTLEVEVDVPRLRKRVAADSGGSGRTGFEWAAPHSEGCGALDEASLREPLEAYGVLVESGRGGRGTSAATTLRLSLRCSDRGTVTHTHAHAAVVEVVASTEGEVSLELAVDARGFASDPEEARDIALDRALGELADALAVEARGELELRVEQPWPAARLGVLESSLRQAVLGVDGAALSGIGPDGAAILRITGNIDIERLARQLQGLSFPGFGLVGLRVDSAHVLRVRMQ